MRIKIVLMTAVVLVLSVLPAATAANDIPAPSTDSIYGGDDQIVTVDFPPGPYRLDFASTAGYADPLGLIDNYQFTSLYTQLGTDRIVVFTCPSRDAVAMTAVQAVAIANDKVQEHFLALPEGKYRVEFVVGGDIPAAIGTSDSACRNYGATEGNYPANVNGAMFVTEISGGYGGPGCAPSPWCPTTWPGNSRAGFVTSDSIMPMVWAHEQGHMLTWPHSSSGTGNDYDNPIGLMSGNLTSFGGSSSTPYETNVANRLAAGWITSGRTMIYNGGTIEVDLATTGTSGTQMIAIEVNQDEFWSIGARISDVNDPFPSGWSGVEVMYVANCGQTCYPLNRGHYTAGQQAWIPGSGRPFHVLGVGESETIGVYGIEVLSRDADSFQIRLVDPSDATLPDDVKRLAGADRYATSVSVSAEVFKDAGAVSTVFVATGSNFPDALGAEAAAGYLGSPVLLVDGTVPGPIAAELARLKPTKIYVVGGTNVVSDAVVAQLSIYGSVERIAGNDRYGTSAQLSKKIFTDPATVSTAFVATGANFPDALGAAAAAGYLGGPVLLVTDMVVPGSVKTELGRLQPTLKYVVGGTAVIPNAVAAQL